MSEVKFCCTYCNQPLEAPQDMGGQAIACPSCKKSITIPQIQETIPPPLPMPPPIPRSGSEKQKWYKTSLDSQDDAIDEKLLGIFLPDLNLSADEELFFFQKTNVVATDLAGLIIPPNYNLMVSSRRVVAIVRDKKGKVSRSEFLLGIIKHVALLKGVFQDTIEIVVSDPTDRTIKFNFVKRKNPIKKDPLEAVVEYLNRSKHGFAIPPTVDSASRRGQAAGTDPDPQWISPSSSINISETEQHQCQSENPDEMLVDCPVCKGSGYVMCPKCKGTKVADCPQCNGRGIRTLVDFGVGSFNKKGALGAMTKSEQCITCRGTGKLDDSLCPQCDGNGVVDCPLCKGEQKITKKRADSHRRWKYIIIGSILLFFIYAWISGYLSMNK